MQIILDEKLEDWPSSRESGMLTTDHNLSIDIPPNPSPVTSSVLSKKHLMRSPSLNAPSPVYYIYLPP